MTVARVPDGIQYPDTGWELTFDDFAKLLVQDTSPDGVRRLLREWCGYRVHTSDGVARLVDATHSAVDALQAHLRIQEDPKSQQAMYNVAMSLWR
jgi:hypothetical protein